MLAFIMWATYRPWHYLQILVSVEHLAWLLRDQNHWLSVLLSADVRISILRYSWETTLETKTSELGTDSQRKRAVLQVCLSCWPGWWPSVLVRAHLRDKVNWEDTQLTVFHIVSILLDYALDIDRAERMSNEPIFISRPLGTYEKSVHSVVSAAHLPCWVALGVNQSHRFTGVSTQGVLLIRKPSWIQHLGR